MVNLSSVIITFSTSKILALLVTSTPEMIHGRLRYKNTGDHFFSHSIFSIEKIASVMQIMQIQGQSVYQAIVMLSSCNEFIQMITRKNAQSRKRNFIFKKTAIIDTSNLELKISHSLERFPIGIRKTISRAHNVT